MSKLLRAGCGGFAVSRLRQNEAGDGLIETALVMPAFLLFVFGLVNFSLVMFGIGNMTYAARYASRYACLHSATSSAPATAQTITSLVTPFIFPYPANTFAATVTYGAGGNVVGVQASVAVTVNYTLSLPLYSYSGFQLTSNASGIITQ